MDDVVQFTPRRSFRNSILFALAAIMIVGGAYLLSFIFRQPWVFLWVSVICGFFVLLILYADWMPGSGYLISKSGIIIKYGRKSESIPLSDIHDVTLLSSDKATVFLNEFQAKMVEHFKQKESQQGLTIRNMLYEFIQFATAGITIGRTKKEEGSAIEVNTTGEFVVVSMSTRLGFLLTPKDGKGFVEAYSKITKD